MKDIMVSIICTAYNHELYISKAISSVLAQKTTFDYEVIIHDDASTDNTASIIKEFQKKDPERVHAIFQKENQFSKNVDIITDVIIPTTRGKYIAFCEGDDFWSDTNKIQMQVDYLENHIECSACVHNTQKLNMKNNDISIIYNAFDRKVGLRDVIVGGGSCYHTSSLMYRKDLEASKPEFLKTVKGVMDYPLSIYLALCGDIFYFGKTMSVYRVNVLESWTSTRKQSDKIDTYKQVITMLHEANEFSDKSYNLIFIRYIIKYWIKKKLLSFPNVYNFLKK